MKIQPAKTKYSIIPTRQKIANSAKQCLDLSFDGMQLSKVDTINRLNQEVTCNSVV